MTATSPVAPTRGPAGRRRPPRRIRQPAPGRVDEDPLGALPGLDAGHLRRGVHRLHRADHLADRDALVRPEGRTTGRQGHLRSDRLHPGHRSRTGPAAIGVLGVPVITSEYSTGVIRASLLAVPRRLPMLAAGGGVRRSLARRNRDSDARLVCRLHPSSLSMTMLGSDSCDMGSPSSKDSVFLLWDIPKATHANHTRT